LYFTELGHVNCKYNVSYVKHLTYKTKILSRKILKLQEVRLMKFKFFSNFVLKTAFHVKKTLNNVFASQVTMDCKH